MLKKGIIIVVVCLGCQVKKHEIKGSWYIQLDRYEEIVCDKSRVSKRITYLKAASILFKRSDVDKINFIKLYNSRHKLLVTFYLDHSDDGGLKRYYLKDHFGKKKHFEVFDYENDQFDLLYYFKDMNDLTDFMKIELFFKDGSSGKFFVRRKKQKVENVVVEHFKINLNHKGKIQLIPESHPERDDVLKFVHEYKKHGKHFFDEFELGKNEKELVIKRIEPISYGAIHLVRDAGYFTENKVEYVRKCD